MEKQPLAALASHSVLVLEDDFLISEYLRAILEDNGAREVCVIHNLDDLTPLLAGRQAGGRPPFTLAVVDIKLGNRMAFEVLLQLVGQGIAFIFTTGLDRNLDIPSQWQHIPLLQKPFKDSDVIEALSLCLPGREAAS